MIFLSRLAAQFLGFLFWINPSRSITHQTKTWRFSRSSCRRRSAVRRIFDVFFDFVDKLSARFQPIVTDHADLNDERFKKAVVERWRGDVKLIPLDWPENSW